MKRMTALLAAAALLCACAELRIGPPAEGEQITAEGMAPLAEGNLALARDNALAAAQRSAVEQVVGVFVSGQTQVQDAVAVRQKIMAGTKGYIKRYKIASEGAAGGYYRVKIRATVLVQGISSAFEEYSGGSRAKVAVLAAETVDSAPVSYGGAGAALASQLEKTGYSVLTPKAETGADAALDAARAAGADYAVIVQADAYKLAPLPELSGQFSPYRARADVKIYSVADRRLAGGITKEASGLDPAPDIAAKKALAAAAGLAAQELSAQLARAANAAGTIVLKITGLRGIEQLRKFQDALRQIPGIEKAPLSSYARGDAFFSVRTRTLSGEELAASLLRINPFALETQSVTQYELLLRAN